MSISGKVKYVTVEEYLRAEERASRRHEYVDGEVFAMTGASERHNIIAVNLGSTLHSHLKGSRCRVFVSEVKLRIESSNSYYYPDVLVGCKTGENSEFASHPVLAIEVLSRSTAAIDRREKAVAYKSLESLREYLIVSQSQQKVLLHRKSGDGSWNKLEFGPGEELTLESIPAGPLKITLDEIYEGVDWQHDGTLRVQERVASYLTSIDEEEDLDW